MKLLLVAVHPYRSPQSVPLAPAFLKGAIAAAPELRRAVATEIHEFVIGDPLAEAAETLLTGDPDVVAFSMYVWNREAIVTLAGMLRERRPELLLVAGGPEPTANPLPLIDCGCFDALIRGEGEVSFVALLAALRDRRPLTGIAGVVPCAAASAVAAGGAACETYSPSPSPEAIPSPYLDGTLNPVEGDGALWQISRGCDFSCSFCFDHRGEKVRRFPMERLEKELRLFAAAGVSQVFVLDSTFNKVPARAKEILRLIARVAPEIHFHFEVRCEFLDPEMAELFASITCSLQIGLQSSDPEVLAGVGRPFDAERFASRIDLLNQTGAIFGFDLIYGLPGDTLPRFRNSLDFALSLYPNHLDIFPLAVLPGTRLAGQAQALGVHHLDAPPYTVVATPEFSADELSRAAALALACDVFYSRGKAVAWFNSVARALKMPPSAFLAAFADWLGERSGAAEEGIGDHEILPMQCGFLEEIFRARRKEKLLPLALDLANYHHLFARALLDPPTVPLTRRQAKGIDVLQVPLRRSPSAAPASFQYDILEILESGECELAAFAAEFSRSGSYAVIYPCRGEVRTEALSRPLFELLWSLNGTTQVKPLLGRFAISQTEARDFLDFMLTEGVVVPSRPSP
ncbi:radical SAM protein [Geomonas sp. Red875]|uniref:Radical SAM protein n=1 Tax=Geomesophilobacter sediminis TaxID=2798584 RepID=A0A8J7JCT1_9BACT|nr:radical SAM protein [Geomesophilobacter sediminis]